MFSLWKQRVVAAFKILSQSRSEMKINGHIDSKELETSTDPFRSVKRKHSDATQWDRHLYTDTKYS